jgi:hypothetical protein
MRTLVENKKKMFTQYTHQLLSIIAHLTSLIFLDNFVPKEFLV